MPAAMNMFLNKLNLDNLSSLLYKISSSMNWTAGNTKAFFGLGICLMLLMGGCKSQKGSTVSTPVQNPELSPALLADSYNWFALDLFKQMEGNSENMIFSPYSISTVLAMCYSGAGGATAGQMAEVLYFPPKGDSQKGDNFPQGEINPSVKNLSEQILSSDTLEGTDINLANAIWAQKGFGFLPEYIDGLGKYYEAPLTEMDFVGEDNREKSRQEINAWVEENTRQKIKDLIGPGVLDASTRMILTNAIYFNGQWQWPFDKNMTVPSLFHTSSTKSQMIDFMHLNKAIPYYEDEDVQAIMLPYKEGSLSMMIILPGPVEGWEMISRVIDYERLKKMKSQFETKEVHISLPKFSTELKTNLKKELTSMGMDKAFGMGADFSGMNGELDLFIDEVIHKAFIEVSENGTEAAAATGAIISLKSALRDEPEIFKADHPFLYLIRDQQTGSIIFMGRLVNPS